jgi:hypothetical protein
MMSVLERPHSIPDTGAETMKPDSRLAFPPSPTARAWWTAAGGRGPGLWRRSCRPDRRGD